MRSLFAVLGGLLLLAGLNGPAEAARRSSQPLCHMDNDGRVTNCQPMFGAPSLGDEVKKIRTKKWKKTKKWQNNHIASSGRGVAIQCGRNTIRVSPSAAVQFEGFCRDLYAEYKFGNVGGIRGGRCSNGSKHPCGGAIDVEQTCRSRGPGHCLPQAFPVARSEQLADKWGLYPGSRWGDRDVGHFETRGTLAGGNWSKDKILQIAARTITALAPPPPPPLHPLLGASSATMQVASAQSGDYLAPLPADLDLLSPPPSLSNVRTVDVQRTMTTAAYYAYAEVLPWGMRPVDHYYDQLKGIPEGTPREEIQRLAAISGLPVQMLLSFARIESSFNCKDKTGKYKGLFQLSEFEFNRYGRGGDIYNCRDNAVAGIHKFVVEATQFENVSGKNPTFAQLYMIHQQGWQGAAEHAAQPERRAIDSMCATDEGKMRKAKWCALAICLNVPSDSPLKRRCHSITSGEFTSLWRGKVERYASLAIGHSMGSHYEVAAVKKKAKVKKRYVKKKRYKYRHRTQYAKV
jgi:hypothetical protein